MSLDDTEVECNVGGKIFRFSKSIWAKCEGSFKAMLEARNDPITYDESGRIFIDRDPEYFAPVLAFMCFGYFKLPESPEAVKEIKREAEHYHLDSLVELCENSQKDYCYVVHLNVRGTVCRTTLETFKKTGNKFAEMTVETYEAAKDSDGCFHIDCDLMHFVTIMEHARGEIVDIEAFIVYLHRTCAEVEQLLAVARYFGSTEICDVCEKRIPILKEEQLSWSNIYDFRNFNWRAIRKFVFVEVLFYDIVFYSWIFGYPGFSLIVSVLFFFFGWFF